MVQHPKPGKVLSGIFISTLIIGFFSSCDCPAWYIGWLVSVGSPVGLLHLLHNVVRDVWHRLGERRSASSRYSLAARVSSRHCWTTVKWHMDVAIYLIASSAINLPGFLSPIAEAKDVYAALCFNMASQSSHISHTTLIWVNYNISLTWNKAILGWFP